MLGAEWMERLTHRCWLNSLRSVAISACGVIPACVLVCALLWIGAAQASAQVRVGTLDFRDHDLDDMGIANPAGITYAPDSGFLFIGYAGADSPTRIFTITPNEVFIDVFDLSGASFTPDNIAYDPGSARLLLYDAAAQQLVVLETEPGGQIDSAAEAVRYDMRGLGALDAQGMVVSPSAARLFILDSTAGELIQIEADAAGNYAVAGAEAAHVSRIPLDVPAAALLRGLAYDGQSDHFYVLDASTTILYKLDAAGQTVMTFDLSDMRLANPRGLASAPSADATDDPALIDLYLTDSGPPPTDGRVIELYLKSLPSSPTDLNTDPDTEPDTDTGTNTDTVGVNAAPVVDAGPDQVLTGTLTTTLNGSVRDDGLPVPPGTVTAFWGTLSGPAWATFAQGRALDTEVTFPTYGVYRLGLFATDGGLGSFAVDEVVITVVEEATAADSTLTPEPVATPAASAALTAGAVLTGVVTPPAQSVQDPAQGSAILFERPITDGWDDAEEREPGNVTNNNDLELVYDQEGNQRVGLRFTEIDIAPGAVISSAYVQFTVDETSTEPAQLLIHGEKSANAKKFSGSTDFDISNRPATSASVAWTPEPWPTPGEAGPAQRTPNLAPVIQEIVSQPQWKRGNALVLVITGTGERVAQAFDLDPANAPVLHIEYFPASPEG